MGLPVWQRGIQHHPQQVSCDPLDCSLPCFDVQIHVYDGHGRHKVSDIEHD